MTPFMVLCLLLMLLEDSAQRFRLHHNQVSNMSLKFDGDYYAKATDVGPRVPPSFPSEKFKQGYDAIRWNNKEDEMDLLTEDPKKVATLIVDGSLILSEVPSIRRPLVRKEIAEVMEARKSKKKEAVEVKAPITNVSNAPPTIEDAIRTILAEGNKEDLTSDGKPIVRAVKAILGKDISAADRNEAYDNVTSEE